MTLLRQREGFTLIELIVAVIVVAVLASVAIPHYLVAVEKGRLTEALTILSSVRDAQVRYRNRWGSYATTMAALDVSIPDPIFFDRPVLTSDPQCNPIVTITRNDNNNGYCGNYRVEIFDGGRVFCIDEAGYTICGKLGYSIMYFGPCQSLNYGGI